MKRHGTQNALRALGRGPLDNVRRTVPARAHSVVQWARAARPGSVCAESACATRAIATKRR